MISHPALNATLNGTSAVLLACGYAAIRAGKRDLHKKLMLTAFFVSCAFLVSYLIYHYRVHRVVLFQGQGWIRPVYFTILISHTILAVVIVPLMPTSHRLRTFIHLKKCVAVDLSHISCETPRL